jgi:RNA polymerase sigma-70 factor, ECF subfamily
MNTIALDWGEIARQHGQRVFQAARTAAPDDDAAWDCVQEAFLTAIASKSPSEIEHPIAWLCGVAKNHARHVVRGEGRFRRMLSRLSRRTPSRPESPPADTREDLHRALGRLPSKLRDAVVLRHLARMSVADVARAQGITEGAAKVRIHRGLGKLRGILGATALLLLLVREAAASSADPLAPLAGAVGATAAGLGTAAGLSIGIKAALATAAVVVIGTVAVLGARSLVVDTPSPAKREARSPARPVATDPQAERPDAREEVRHDTATRWGRARGVVLDPDGRPAPGARVVFATAGPEPMTIPDLSPAEVVCDEKGRFVHERLPTDPDYVAVGALSPHRKNASRPFHVAAGEEITGLTIRLGEGMAIFGRVVDEEGRPLEGARVHVTTGRTTYRYGASIRALQPDATTTSADGTYRLAGLENRTYRVFAELRGYFPKHEWGATATPEGGEAPTLVLTKGLFFSGSVVDEEGRPLVANVLIPNFGQTRSGEDGRFELLISGPGSYWVTVWARGFLPTGTAEAVLPLAEPWQTTLRRGLAIEGVVLDAHGSPIDRAMVRAFDETGKGPWAMSDEEGRFVLGGLPPGPRTLSVRAEGFFPTFPGIAAGARDVKLRAQPDVVIDCHVVIAGRVVGPDGTGLENAWVTIQAASGSGSPRDPSRYRRSRTDDAGGFRAEKLRGPPFAVSVRHRDFLPSALSGVTGDTENLLIRLRKGMRISGTLVSDDPLPDGISMGAYDPARKRTLGGHVDEQGGFTVGPLPPGRVTLVFQVEDGGRLCEVPDVAAGTTGLRVQVDVPTGFLKLQTRRPRRVPSKAWGDLWTDVADRGAEDAEGVVSLLPEIARARHAEEGLVLAVLHVLLRIGTPEATHVMVEIFADSDLTGPSDLRRFGPELMDVDHPGIAPAAAAWFRRCVDQGLTSWCHMNPLTALLAKHGGDEAVRILEGVLRDGKPSGQAVSAAAKALVHATDPRLLAAGLAWLDQGNSGIPVAVGLIDAFGERAVSALLDRGLDTKLPTRRRETALAALATRCPPQRVDDLLRLRPDWKDGALFVTVARNLPARKDSTLLPRQVALLEQGMITLLDVPDPGLRIRASRTIESTPLYRTERMIAALVKRLEVEKNHSVRNVIEKTIEKVRLRSSETPRSPGTPR